MNTLFAGPIGYLGPAGSWTHQACLDLYGDHDLVPLSPDELFHRYRIGALALACVPVTASVVGATPYLDAVLGLPHVTIVAEYPRMLGYSLLARPGTRREGIKQVLAHPVAFEEVRPWLEREMPNVSRVPMASAGAAAVAVAHSPTCDKALFGPRLCSVIYPLVSLVRDIEHGPHNVTRWWVLGRTMPAATGHDKTSLLIDASDEELDAMLGSLRPYGVRVLTAYERPSKRTLDTHRYLIEVAGHAQDDGLARFLACNERFRLLGSYPRKI